MKPPNLSCLGILFLCLCASNLSAASKIDDVKSELLASHSQSAAVQQQIDQLHQSAGEAEHQYRTLMLQLDSVNAYNQQLQQRMALQQQSLSDIAKQLVSVTEVDREIIPLMLKMQQSLANFVAADLPFLRSQRNSDLAQLERDLKNVLLPVSDKYQNLLQAFLREEKYSHVMHSYQAQLQVQGGNMQVNYLQLGRMALYYQSLEGGESALWSQRNNTWLSLDSAANKELSQAIKMAGGQAVTRLLNFTLPEVLAQ
ncbi:MAG: DUF3450 domain-containing protein [Pseudomonadales bacterium]|nr:DUF3450 domain-containing protein [Pseudomonadales bacterium]NRA15974.1 DUF3450 domain-containing protein [Oceanospirillaceae bacterium]